MKTNRLSLLLKSCAWCVLLLFAALFAGCGGESVVHSDKILESAEEDDESSADSVITSSDSQEKQNESSSSSKKKSIQDDEDMDDDDEINDDDGTGEEGDDSGSSENEESVDDDGLSEYVSVARPTKLTSCGRVPYTDKTALPLRTWGYFGYVLALKVSSTSRQTLYLAFDTTSTKINGPEEWGYFSVLLAKYNSKESSWVEGTEIYSANKVSAAPLDGGKYSTVNTYGKFEKFEFDIEGTWLERYAGKNINVIVTFYAPGIKSDSSGFGLDYYAIPEKHPSLLYTFEEMDCPSGETDSSGSSSGSQGDDDLSALLKNGNWIWNGTAHETRVYTSYSGGGIWFPYSDQDGGGSSYFDWDVSFFQEWGNGVRDDSYVDALVQSCGAICGEAHLQADGYAGIGFDVVGAAKIGADISSCGGFEVVYTTEADITMGLEEGNRAEYSYDDYRAVLKATTKPQRATLSWDDYSQRGDKSTAQNMSDMLKNIVMIDFQYIASSSFDSKFKIYALGTINPCLIDNYY